MKSAGLRNKVIQNKLQQNRAIYTPSDVKKEAMDNLIQKKIIQQYAQQLNIITSIEEIDFVINNILERKFDAYRLKI